MKFLFTLLLAMNIYASNIVLEADNTVALRDEFSSGSVANVINKLQSLHSKLPEYKEINLYLDSPGGEIVAGEELIKFVNSLDRKVNVICNFCASMAFQTLEGIQGKRVVTPMGVLMSHKAYGGFVGEFPGQVENRLNFWLRRLKRMDEELVKRTNGKQTLESYQALYENEYWCTDQDCINDGFADEIANVSCAKSLSGTETIILDTYFGPYELVVSKCPVITGVIKYRRLDRDGDPTTPFITNRITIRDLLMKGRSIQQINAINLNATR